MTGFAEENSFAVFFPIEKMALERSAVVVLNFAGAMEFVFFEFSRVEIAVLEMHLAVSVLLTVEEVSVIFGFVGLDQNSEPVRQFLLFVELSGVFPVLEIDERVCG